MTTTFGTNSDNDLYLGADGNIVVLSGLDAIIGACETATKAQLGEMVLQTILGIPNFQTVWVGDPQFALFSSYLRNTLNSVDGVQEVTSLDVKSSNDKLVYSATIKTQFGTGIING